MRRRLSRRYRRGCFCAHWSNSWHVLACVYLLLRGVEGAGGGMETYCCADSRWFPRETAGSDGISYGSRSRRICAVGSQTLPCQGASPCTDALVPLLWLTCSAARKVVFILIIMRWDQGKVAEARVHRTCMKTVETLPLTHTCWLLKTQGQHRMARTALIKGCKIDFLHVQSFESRHSLDFMYLYTHAHVFLYIHLWKLLLTSIHFPFSCAA